MSARQVYDQVCGRIHVRFAPRGSKDPLDPNHWQEKILYTFLLIALPLGGLVFAGNFSAIVGNRLWFILASDILAYGVLIFLFVCPEKPFLFRAVACCSMVYLVGVAILISLGPFYASREWLFVFSLVASVLLGWPGALTSIGVNTATWVMIGALLYNGFLPNFVDREFAMVNWIHISIDMVFLNVCTALFITFLFRRLQASDRLAKLKSLALKDSEKKYRRLTENAKAIIFRLSLPGGYIEYISPAVHEISGYFPEELVASPKKIFGDDPPGLELLYPERMGTFVIGTGPCLP